MDILHPSRINSFHPTVLHVVIHTKEKRETIVLEDVFPFETLYNIKQRIAVHKQDKGYLPDRLFVAQEIKGGLRPLEFKWSFIERLQDPLDDEVLDVLQPQLVSVGNEILAEFPTLYSGIRVENIVDTKQPIHVWSVVEVAKAGGYSTELGLPQAKSFHGFFKLYFPFLTSVEMLHASFTAFTKTEKEQLGTVEKSLQVKHERLVKIENLLQTFQTTHVINLRELTYLRFVMDHTENFNAGDLELKFYELVPNATIPFIRFFSSNDRVPPIVKIAKGPSGRIIIQDKRTMDYMMADIPATNNGSVLLLKLPIKSYKGVVWTFRIMEDGSADVYIEAPRADELLSYDIMKSAFEVLESFLQATPWADHSDMTLIELNAKYEINSDISGKPTANELKRRCDVLTPIVQIMPPKNPQTAISLLYTAVNNFVAESDPVGRFLTSLYLRHKMIHDAQTDIPVKMFIEALQSRFDYSEEDATAFVSNWIDNITSLEDLERKGETQANLGCMIDVLNTHPKYFMQTSNIESVGDLRRIVSVMSLLVSYTSKDLAVADTVEEQEAVEKMMEVVEPPPPKSEEVEMDVEQMAIFGLNMEAEPEPEPEAKHETIPVPMDVPIRKTGQDVIIPKLKQWHIERLTSHNSKLFVSATEIPGRETQYVRQCQVSSGKQPFVMSLDTYKRVREIYKDDAFWIEAPLDSEDIEAITIAYKSYKERNKPKKSYASLIKMEIRALEMGFPLKDDKSIIELDVFKKDVKPEDKERIHELIAVQKSRPLMTVARLGTSMENPNYYMCAIYWCVHDDLPLLPNDFLGDTFRGIKKEPESCPFCGGKVIASADAPKKGETVLKRKPTTTGGPIASFVGFPEVKHPDGYVQPCCFTTPVNLDVYVPKDSGIELKPFPPAQIPLPPNQSKDETAAVAPAPPPPPPEKAEDRQLRDRPFTEKRGKTQNQWYIPFQNVLGRSTEKLAKLAKGTIAIPSRSVNELLGQDPEQFLTITKGLKAVGQNPKLKMPGTGFVRYGLGLSVQEPGKNIYSLLSYAEYATNFLKLEDDTFIIRTPEEVMSDFNARCDNMSMVHAFNQANYGTLLHEFSLPGQVLEKSEESKFEAWWAKLGTLTSEDHEHQRAFAVQLYLAFQNFKNYMNDIYTAKDLRYFETLFAAQNIFTITGFILVRIMIPKDADAQPYIQCPEFGIASFAMETKPPLLFILEDEASGYYDPLVFYNGHNDVRTVMGVLQDELPIFDKLHPNAQHSLHSFLSQYYSQKDGCGKKTADVFPWIPVEGVSHLPKLFELLTVLQNKDVDIKPIAQLRDRSNRLTGLIVVWDKKTKKSTTKFYLPVLDDGSFDIRLPSFMGETALPRPALSELLEMLTGLQNKIGETKITHYFRGYMPYSLQMDEEQYHALRLANGAYVPIAPLSVKAEVYHKRFKDAVARREIMKDMPWDTDISVLHTPSSQNGLDNTSEEKLNESYQYLRIAFSNWLQKDGKKVREQIELLRQARRRLPLYELQKRLDILLTAVIANPSNPWLTTAGLSHPTLLRRDCLAIQKKDKCVGSCSWSNGRCLIHTTATERYMDPVRVLIARLTDELLRTFGYAQEILQQKVSQLRPLAQDYLIDDVDALMFSAEGRATSKLYEKLGYSERQPSDYTRGLTYPEEVEFPSDGVEGLPASWAEVVQYAKYGGDIMRDKSAILGAILYEITNQPLEMIESALHDPFYGSPTDWKKFAMQYKYEVLYTSIDPTTRLVSMSGMYASDAETKRYILLDEDGLPLQNKKTNKYVMKKSELPTFIQNWIDEL